MKPTVSIRKALSDPNLLGTTLAGDSWSAWRILLIAMMGEALNDDERVIFKALTQREREPMERVDEFAAVIGRRGGKSRAMATIAAYLAGLCDYTDTLVPGERGIVLSIAPNSKQAQISLNYAEGVFRQSPILRQLIANRTADALELTNGIALEVRSASFRSLRGPTYAAVLADECAFWQVEGSSLNPDSEILAAVRPGLITTRGPLILASSPYARKGELWQTFKRHFGAEGDARILVAKGTSRDLNPSLPQSFIDRQLERDRAHATAEYLAEFRTDIESFVPMEVIEACLGDYREQLPVPDVMYHAFTDPSGGSADSFTLAIAHKDGDQVIIDAVRERKPPFSPEDVVAEFATLILQYHTTTVFGDRYAGEFPRELFAKHGVMYAVSELTKSDLFRDLLPRLNSASISLPRNDRLISQLASLERVTSRAGKDSISHPPGGHDDVANAVAGAAALASAPGFDETLSWVGDPHEPIHHDPGEARAQRLRDHLRRCGVSW